ncbi:MAG: tRNA pseudouridine(38-40) synthase TruA [Candidatus Hydrogenedentes bacterium]|nr:tRNA pseudouridine(38-40) synthase TruA [Candidatus Hydrogenedentota bacterium]
MSAEEPEIADSSHVMTKAVVRYVGTGFAGWQVQPRQRTVQGALEEALRTISGQPVRVTGAGRTDSGVHALGQVCSFVWRANADLDQLRRSLSCMLAPEIRVLSIEPAPREFHARKSAAGKRYSYSLYLGPEADPFTAAYAWRVSPKLNLDRLASLCPLIEGEHDFAGFQSSGASEKLSTVRTLHSVRLAPGGVFSPLDARDLWRVEFHGNGFLYKMIRNIVGTFTEIARGALSESRIEERLSSPGPYRGLTAPAHGLTLIEVLYDPPAPAAS